jgi:hypothetical protein
MRALPVEEGTVTARLPDSPPAAGVTNRPTLGDWAAVPTATTPRVHPAGVAIVLVAPQTISVMNVSPATEEAGYGTFHVPVATVTARAVPATGVPIATG